ncbi:MAG: class I SAM-dependent methyltransferase [Gemmataceae bacterium]
MNLFDFRRTSVFRTLRKMKRSAKSALTNTSMSTSLAESVYPVVLAPKKLKLEVDQNSSFECEFLLTNHGPQLLSGYGAHPIQVRATWRPVKNESAVVLQTDLPLPGPVFPREAVSLNLTLPTPAILGNFSVEWNLMQSGRVVSTGAKPPRTIVRTLAKSSEDIDYHLLYAHANLKDDYWFIVGPSTRAEFHRLAQAKLDQLVKLGLTPDSRVLDIGCGTGQLTLALEGYLSDKGRYYGTDIGSEGIDYCRQHYKRPNFAFAVNEMTSVPIEKELFDFVTFISVFTHTYPDETVLLLAEAKRLLAPKGIIIADVFTSSIIDRCEGNRGAMELNREHFLRLVDLAGLTATKHESWKWKEHSEREVYLITHKK